MILTRSSLTFLAYYLNSAAEAEKGTARLSFEDVHGAMRDGSLFTMLERTYPEHFDFSIFEAGTQKRADILEALAVAAGGLEGRERKKTGVEHSGIHLLVAIVLETIQQHF